MVSVHLSVWESLFNEIYLQKGNDRKGIKGATLRHTHGVRSTVKHTDTNAKTWSQIPFSLFIELKYILLSLILIFYIYEYYN